MAGEKLLDQQLHTDHRRRVRVVPKSVCYLHVHQHTSAQLPLHGYTSNLVLRASVKIGRRNPNLVEISQKYPAFYVKTCVRFIVAGDIQLS